MEEASLAHLLGRLHVIESRVRAAVARRRAGDPDPEDRFRGLYISQAQVERLLNQNKQAPVPDATAAKELEEIEGAADSAEARGADVRLRRLARSFHLDPLDVELLLIALAPDLDPRFERLYGYLQDDVSRRRASIGLSLELSGVSLSSATARGRVSAGSPLVDGYLVHVEEGERPFLSRSLRVPDRVAAYMLGDDTPDPAIAALAVLSEPVAIGDVTALVKWLENQPRLAYIRERRGTSGISAAAAAFTAIGRPTLALDMQRLRSDDDPLTLAALAAREARLLRSGLVVGPIDVLVGRDLRQVRAFSEMPGPVILVGSHNWDPLWSRRVPFVWDAPPPSVEQRAEFWRASLDFDSSDFDPAAATVEFKLTPEQVRRAATAARLQAESAGRPIQVTDVKAGARAQNAAGLERLARRIEPSVRFRDLVLPREAKELLRELVVRARQQEQVLDVWKMGGASSRRRGLSTLFAGPSGTGKTLAAEVIAGELGLDLYLVDLATVVDKYIGETEKNLDRIFVEAERVNGVLLFDEADALFGKRSEVSDAHDRYANIEVAYLLQRMEFFDGIAILATNLRSNLDDAFARRLDAVVDFPEPEREHRHRLWEMSLGSLLPRSDDLDLDFLARSFKLTGGHIRNIVLAAAYGVAEDQRPVSMADLIRATHREYSKLGRLFTEAEFGPYYRSLMAENDRAASIAGTASLVKEGK